MVQLDMRDADLAWYEWVEEGKGYREWLLPAALLNAKGSVTLDDVRLE
jgi:hypothetical protein